MPLHRLIKKVAFLGLSERVRLNLQCAAFFKLSPSSWAGALILHPPPSKPAAPANPAAKSQTAQQNQ
jgi:hypothetical protein